MKTFAQSDEDMFVDVLGFLVKIITHGLCFNVASFLVFHARRAVPCGILFFVARSASPTQSWWVVR